MPKCSILLETSKYLYDPKKFWNTIRSSSGQFSSTEPPSLINEGSCMIIDKSEIFNCFNDHFISEGFLFESSHESIMTRSQSNSLDSLVDNGNVLLVCKKKVSSI